MSGSLGDIFDFQKFLGKDTLEKWGKDPERALLGINNPLETGIWGRITGKDYEPTIDMFGGNTKNQASDAAASGINTGPGEKMHDLARTIASLYGGSYLLGALGGAGGATGGAGGAQVFPVGGGGSPEIAGFATGSDPFVAASGGSLMGAPGTMPTAAGASSPMGWQQYARLANMGSSLMGGGQNQYQPQQLHTSPQGVLMSPQYMPEFNPVYPGALPPFTKGPY